MDKIELLYIVDRKDCSNTEFEDDFFWLASTEFERIYPNDEIPEKSVSVGNIYRNKSTISCQIKFTKNNTICQCNYNIISKKYTIKFYRLTEERNFYAGRDKDSDEIEYYFIPKKEEIK